MDYFFFIEKEKLFQKRENRKNRTLEGVHKGI
jgi:hypothetical protein